MLNSAIASSIRYMADGATCAWPVPFPYGAKEDVAVTVADADGKERRLAYGRDYVLSGNCVIAVVPAGASVLVWLDASANDAVAAASARAMQVAYEQPTAGTPGASVYGATAATSAYVATGAQVQPQVYQAASAGEDARITELAGRIEKMESERDHALLVQQAAEKDAQIAAIRKTASEVQELAAEQIDAQAKNALDEIYDKARAALAAAEDAARQAEEARALAEKQSVMLSQALEEMRVAASAATMQVDESAARASAAMMSEADAAVARAQTAVAKACDCAVNQEIARQSILNLEGWRELSAAINAGMALELPDGLGYWPERHSMRVAKNGVMLVQGLDWVEVGDAKHISTHIHILKAARAGDIFHFWIAASNSTRKAADAADMARGAKERAEDAAYRAGQNMNVAEQARDAAEAARVETQGIADDARLNIRDAETSARAGIADDAKKARKDLADDLKTGRVQAYNIWQAAVDEVEKARRKTLDDMGAACAKALNEANAAKKGAEDAASASGNMAATSAQNRDSAWDAAFCASHASARPGLASVKSEDELWQSAGGMYIINPNVMQPTIFMGVYPVKDLSEILWDGFFFIGPAYPENPNPNPNDPAPGCRCKNCPAANPQEPAGPEQPSEPSASAQGGWIPCDHSHGQKQTVTCRWRMN